MRTPVRVVAIMVVGVLAAALSLVSSAPATSSAGHGLIAYSSGFILFDPDLDNPSQVFTVRPDGSQNRQLTHVPDGKQAGAPDISPDGRSIVYVSNEGADHFAVWMMDIDGAHQHRVFGRDGYDFYQPRWSPGGKRLVVSRCDDHLGLITNCDILVTRANGSHQRRLMDGNRFSHNPVWSPDGRRIAFDSDLGGYLSSVWVVRAGGGKPVRITKPDLEAFWPNWSPDGSHLVISSNCCRPLSQVFTIRADGSGLRQLTHATGGGGPAFASYSPDGRHIAYISDQLRGPDFDHADLFVMRADGSHQHRILAATQNVFGPDWQRVGR